MQVSKQLDWFEDRANLREVRKQLGIAQTALAEMSGVNAAWIASAETGRIRLIGPKAQALWDALEKTFQYANRRCRANRS